MTYAIGEIIYGINLTDSGDFDVDQDELEEFKESHYVDSAYNGNGVDPYWLGVKVGEIDECSNMCGSELLKKITATDKHKEEFQTKLEQFRADEDWSQALRDAVIAKTPDVWLLWGSS